MPAKSIMIQGTMSSAGKSLVTAGLCRIFKQDGFKVAPFKSQNMALNSFITREGLEMGRAQVMQAEAAGLEPDVKMNPILLKPTSDKGSQVIVHGEVWGNMTAQEYYRQKKKLVPSVLESYQALARQYDIIVLEGAGSPAEINLKEEDIVNMGMAKMAKSPVLLVGDIDRGGVFAALTGTMMLLDESERAMVKGTVINKFRGDKEILVPGLKTLEELTGVPVLGVIPYLHIDLDDEDSLAERLDSKKEKGMADIAVIRLPRMSNFTDFNVFELIPGVSLRYVQKAGELKNPDLIIIPGTKNTMGDLEWLRQKGLEGEILKAAEKGTVIFGVCGGYQMLGQELADPYGVEHGGTMNGLGLLNARTVFAPEKIRTRVQGGFKSIAGSLSGLSGMEIGGYEIHMGATENLGGCLPLTRLRNTFSPGEEGILKDDGLMNEQGTVLGSYLHGIFDGERVAEALIEALMKRKGIEDWRPAGIDIAEYKKAQYDILAGELRQSLDMARIYQIIERGLE